MLKWKGNPTLTLELRITTTHCQVVALSGLEACSQRVFGTKTPSKHQGFSVDASFGLWRSLASQFHMRSDCPDHVIADCRSSRQF